MHNVSLIATVYNEAESISRFVQSIRAQTRQPDEIVIVDGGSTDGTPDIIRCEMNADIPLRLIVQPGLNISQGRNLAIREATGLLIACSDAGCVLHSDWLEKITMPLLKNDQVDVVSGLYALECHNLLQQCVGLATMPGQLDPPDPDKFLPSARSVAFRKTVWEAAGGYPEWLYTGEDTLFDRKLKKMGFRFHFAPNALVDWQPRTSWRGIAKQFYLYARGGGHLGRATNWLMWAAKRVVILGTIGAVGIFYWPVWLLCFPVVVYDHIAGVHPIAAKVQKRCGQQAAYWVTSGILWLIRVVRTIGYLTGTLQRLVDRSTYVRSQTEYMSMTRNVE